MIYVRMNKERAWHIPKFGIAGADALCGVESPGLFRGWNQVIMNPLGRPKMCERCNRAYRQWVASDAAWPVPYICEFCGAIEEMCRYECYSCGRRVCGKCAAELMELYESDASGKCESVRVWYCRECYYPDEAEDGESSESDI